MFLLQVLDQLIHLHQRVSKAASIQAGGMIIPGPSEQGSQASHRRMANRGEVRTTENAFCLPPVMVRPSMVADQASYSPCVQGFMVNPSSPTSAALAHNSSGFNEIETGIAMRMAERQVAAVTDAK